MKSTEEVTKYFVTKEELVEYSYQASGAKKTGKIAEMINEIIDKMPEPLGAEAKKLNALLHPEDRSIRNRFAIPYLLVFEDASKDLKEYVDNLWVRFTVLPD